MVLFEFNVYGDVTPDQSTRFRVVTPAQGKPWVHTYKDKNVTNYQAYARQCAVTAFRASGLETLDCSLRVDLWFWLRRPKSRPARRFPFPDRKPDLGNLEKPLIDAIEKAGVMVNDSRICDLILHKRYADGDRFPGCTIQIQSMEDIVDGEAEQQGLKFEEGAEEGGEEAAGEVGPPVTPPDLERAPGSDEVEFQDRQGDRRYARRANEPDALG